jgi:TonB family protein
MFDPPKPGNSRSRLALLTSLLVHCAIVYFWLNRAPIFVQPSAVVWGLHGRSENLIYFPRTAPQEATAKRSQLHLKAKHKAVKEVPQNTVEFARAGAPEGSLARGPASGTEAKPALPLVFPDPTIFPWQLPKGLQGDVVVEVTIDEKGNVTETRILQSLQQDIDQKVVATLKGWRFRPATVDGVAISSRQDMHFHFPS